MLHVTSAIGAGVINKTSAWQGAATTVWGISRLENPPGLLSRSRASPQPVCAPCAVLGICVQKIEVMLEPPLQIDALTAG